MAIITRDQVTLVDMTDVESVITYYLKQSSSMSPPSVPTTNPPPSSWKTTEPSYSSGETATLYTVVCTTFSNGDFDYSAVSKSSAYEAAKEAYNKAVAASSVANQALTSANGKNQIFHQASQPSGGTYISGDTWFDTNDGYKMYTYNGTSWVAEQFGSNAITASAIKTSHLDAGAVTAAKIQSHTITATQLATDAIKSSNYQASTNADSPYSATGTFINLSDGTIYTPNFGVDNTNGKAYINGEIIATSGSIGNSVSNYWEIGTKTDYNMAQSAALIAHGTSYIQSGVLQLSGNKLNTQSYDANRSITYPRYEYYWDFENQRDTVASTYYDFGMQAPEFDTSAGSYVAGVSDLFLYGRRHKSTIPTLETDWEYLFKVDKDGTIYENGVKLSDKYALITDVGSVYLPTSGGTITGDLTVNGTLTATASSAKKTTGSLSVNGKSFNGSSNVTVGTIGVGYGGTGATSFTSGAVLIGNGGSAIQTRSIANNTTISNLGWTSSNGTYITTLNTLAYFNGEYASGRSNISHFSISGSNTSHTFGSMASENASDYLPIVGGTLSGPLTVNDELSTVSASVGDLTVTGSGRFTNGIYGNLTGDVTGNAATATKATQDGDGNTISSTYLKRSGGTMTGTLTLLGGQSTDGYNGALNANNSDIYGLNSIYTADAADDAREGFHFYRDATHVDSFWVRNGVMYFVPNRVIGTGTTASNSNVVIHSGNYNTYAPSLTGAGASGTWGISISGNAATATSAGKWTNSISLTVGGASHNVDGSGAVSFTKTEISGNATAQAAGWMSASDKAKLDSINISNIDDVVTADTIVGSDGVSVSVADGIAHISGTFKVPTTSGSNGQLIVSNGTTGVWTNAGTAANNLVNALSTGSSQPVDSDYYIAQYAGGGTSTTSYHRRPHSALWGYISGKISSSLGLTSSNYSGVAAKATGDGDGNTISSTYLKLSGGTMTGELTLKSGQYADSYSGALNANNSNIYNLNSIYTADAADNAAEGFHFYRDSTHVDTFWVKSGVMYFVPNRTVGTGTTAANSNVVLHSGNYNTYAPSLTGAGASGTWGINISGNAGTATTANSATKATQDGSGNTITTYYCTLSTAQTVSGAKTFSGNNTFSGTNSFTNTTDSTSLSTGAVKLSGGLGVAKNVSANSYLVGNHARLSYNATYSSLEFTFE